MLTLSSAPNSKQRSSTATARTARGKQPTTDDLLEALPAGNAITVAGPPSAEGIPWSALELGPPLPMAVFTSLEVWHPERIGALAIYCSDGRWGEAFDEFCHKHLHIPRYDRMALAGGPACFAPHDSNSKALCESALEQLAFLVKVHELERIVLITHYGCAAYSERLQRSPDDCLPTQLEDLRAVTGALRGWFPHVQIESYLAMRQGSILSFHWLNA